ncbi:PREDICTED: probable E3 ubiquitin-protein ligase HERC4 isoform X1 [Branchiostoma belcheri]|uniref:Probable E3 ubiquitin-protein ligase HERC4 isoform X1 n=1 Tax=Branchiostoma belcheri TaxID=7741 RepID=A0A6P4XTG0_BRABE|nr:PREDICTED: probable E3 ubiquitin-protein ligase HERC4 isoform X1 [Branchiostoma belcheri]
MVRPGSLDGRSVYRFLCFLFSYALYTFLVIAAIVCMLAYDVLRRYVGRENLLRVLASGLNEDLETRQTVRGGGEAVIRPTRQNRNRSREETTPVSDVDIGTGSLNDSLADDGQNVTRRKGSGSKAEEESSNTTSANYKDIRYLGIELGTSEDHTTVDKTEDCSTRDVKESTEVTNSMAAATLFCWGAARNGELGLGGIEEDVILAPKEQPFAVTKTLREVSCGRQHTVFVLAEGTVYTCGSNDYGQLGQDKGHKRPTVITALDTQSIQQVSCGDYHNMVVNDKHQVFSWGFDDCGQLGQTESNNSRRPRGESDDDPDLEVKHSSEPRMVKELSSLQIVQVACGGKHSLALANDGRIFSWGNNSHGQLGIGSTQNQSKPQELTTVTGIPFCQIVAGGAHSFVLSKSGAVFGFGRNTFGQLGLGDTKDRQYPTHVKSLRSLKVAHIACGEEHTAVLTLDGGVLTFGAGSYGQLGHNSNNHEALPRKVFELMGLEVTQLACGRMHTMAYVESSGRIYSFGLGGNGQLGSSGTTNCNSPTTVEGPFVPFAGNCGPEEEQCYVVQTITAGGDQTFALACKLQGTPKPLDFREAPQHRQILSLSNDVINTWSQIPPGAKLSPDVSRDIHRLFSSAACLNGSFLHSNHFYCSSRNPGVDVGEARAAFYRLGQTVNKDVLQTIYKSMTETLLKSLPQSPPDTEALRLYLLLPLMHFFDQGTCAEYVQVPGHLGCRLTKLEGAAKKIIDIWLSHESCRDLYHRLLNAYKNIAVMVITKLRTVDTVQAVELQGDLNYSLRVLETLNRVNSRHDMVPYEQFYISEINGTVDIKRDYLMWLQQTRGYNNLPVLHGLHDIYFCSFPFVFDAQAKTELLQTDAFLQMQLAVEEVQARNFQSLFLPIDPVNPYLVLIVSRENLVQDTLNQLMKQASADLKKPLKVIFIGEEAIDAGGLKKEFFLLIIKEVMDPKFGMFRHYEETQSVWFHDRSFEESSMFFLIGVLCGLAIYNSTIIDLPFPLALYKKLLKRNVTLDDLKQMQPDVGSGLEQLLGYNGDDFEDVFCLNFTIACEYYGSIETVELVKNGNNISVTKENREEYVNAYVEHVLNKSVENQFDAFGTGFHKVCGGKVLELFHPKELMAMVCGNENYDWAELEKNVEYKGVYHKNHPTIHMFWDVFHHMTLEEKKKFLLFLTGCDKIPILGMKALKIYIQPTMGGDSFLPAAHTCFNLLDLPMYTSREVLRIKLTQAIENTSGFGLV